MSAASPECGPAAVENVPVTTSTSTRRASTSPSRPSQRRHERLGRGRAACPSASSATTTPPAEHDEREQEVRHDEQRVQVE